MILLLSLRWPSIYTVAEIFFVICIIEFGIISLILCWNSDFVIVEFVRDWNIGNLTEFTA
jgi:hypothetical protein